MEDDELILVHTVRIEMEGGYMPDVNDVYETEEDAIEGVRFWVSTYENDETEYNIEEWNKDSFYAVSPPDAGPHTLRTLIIRDTDWVTQEEYDEWKDGEYS